MTVMYIFPVISCHGLSLHVIMPLAFGIHSFMNCRS